MAGPVVRAVAQVGESEMPAAGPPAPPDDNERYFIATQRQLIWRAFRRHRLAFVSALALLALYLTMACAEFLGPYAPFERYREAIHHPPTRIRLLHDGRFIGPFVYRYEHTLDMQTLRRHYDEDRSQPYRLRLLHRGASYRLWGLFASELHLFGVDEPGKVFLLGTDDLGRDMFSRITRASRISLSIGLVGVLLSFLLGASLGAFSGYFGGAVDTAIQRVIELLRSIPTIPCGWDWRRRSPRPGRCRSARGRRPP